MSKKKKNQLLKFFNISILSIIVGGTLTFLTQRSLQEKQLSYEFKVNVVKEKIELYKRTSDIYQKIINELQPNFETLLLLEKTLPFTQEYASIMNQNALYFDKNTVSKMERITRNEYWRLRNGEVELILKAMVDEIRRDREELDLF